MRIPWPRRAREPRFCSARILLPPCSPSRPSRLHWARPGWPSGARAPVLSSADTIANASRRTTMSRPQGIPTRAAAFTLLTALVLATTAHAARPRFEDEALERPARPRPTIAMPEHWTLGQPVRFPRELLPLIMGEMEVPITEPAPEPASVLRSLIPAPESHRDATPFGANRLLNDPTGDPLPVTGIPSATQSENSLAAHGRFLASGWEDSVALPDPQGEEAEPLPLREPLRAPGHHARRLREPRTLRERRARVRQARARGRAGHAGQLRQGMDRRRSQGRHALSLVYALLRRGR